MFRKTHRLVWIAGAAALLFLSGCTQDGQVCLFGYSSAPNYDTKIKYVRVPIFENRTFRQGIEFQLTKAVITAIEAGTPYKVTQDPCLADAELTGVITSAPKSELLVNPLNEARQLELDLVVDITYKNLHTGEILSRPTRRPGTAVEEFPQPAFNQLPGVAPQIITPPSLPGEVGANDSVLAPQPLPPGAMPKYPPVTLRSVATFVPELGYSMGTATDTCVKKMAIQIINLMEKPW